MLVLQRNSHVSTPRSHRTQCDIYPKAVPVFLCPGPNRQECETRMSACTWQPPAGSGTKPGPVQVGGMARSGEGEREAHPAPRPGRSERLALALGANSLYKGAGTWARDVLSPERRQAGTAGPLFQPSASVDGRRAGSHVTPLDAKCCMLGEACTTGEKFAAGAHAQG